MLRIDCIRARTIVFTISGRLGADNVYELCQLIDQEPAVAVLVLDLRNVILANRDAVHLLSEYEVRGRVVLRNCPAYIRTLMAAENDQR